MKNKLTPCPHCKGDVRPSVQKTKPGAWKIVCSACGCGPNAEHYRRRDAEDSWEKYVEFTNFMKD